MAMTRRKFMAGAVLGAGAAVRPKEAWTQQPGLGRDRLGLLGTKGGPRITRYAPGPSSKPIVYRDVPYVIDAGYGITLKLVETGLPLPALRYVFITHHHSDHNLELGPLLYNAWATGLRRDVDAFGPAGIQELLDAYGSPSASTSRPGSPTKAVRTCASWCACTLLRKVRCLPART